MSIRLVLAPLLCLSGLAQGQLTPKEASSMLKSATSTSLKALKADLKANAELLDVATDTLKDAADAGTFTLADFDTFCTAVDNFQRDVAADLNSTAEDVAQAAAETVAALPPELFVKLPEGFYIGDGKTMDKFRTDALKAVGKTYSKVGKKMRKAADELSDEMGARMTFRLEPPRDLETWVSKGPNQTQESLFLPLTVDFALVCTDGEGVSHACLGGSADTDDGTVTFSLEAQAGGCLDGGTSGTDGRWTGTMDMGFAGQVCPANYYCGAEQGGDMSWLLSIGWPGVAP